MREVWYFIDITMQFEAREERKAGETSIRIRYEYGRKLNSLTSAIIQSLSNIRIMDRWHNDIKCLILLPHKICFQHSGHIFII